MPVRYVGKSWWYDVQVNGERLRGRIAEARNKTEAQKALDRVKGELLEGNTTWSTSSVLG